MKPTRTNALPLVFAIIVLTLIECNTSVHSSATVLSKKMSVTYAFVPSTAQGTIASVTSALTRASSLTFAAEMTVSGEGSPETISVHGQVQRPNLLLINAEKDGKPVAVAVSDGSNLTVYSTSTGHFVKIPMGADGPKMNDPTMFSFLRGEIGDSVAQALLSSTETFFKPDLDLSHLVPPSPTVSQKFSATRAVSELGGTPVVVVTQHLDLSSSQAPGSRFDVALKLTVDKRTLALRSMSFGTSRDGQPATDNRTIDYSHFDLSSKQLAQSTFTFALPATASAYVAPPASMDTGSALKAGATAPDFTVQTASGSTVKLSNYAGKVVVLDLWATWCGPCQMSLPHTDKLASAYGSKGVVFLPICVSDTKSNFNGWLAKHKTLTMAFLFDPAGRSQSSFSSALYHVDSIPTQFVIGKDGKIAATFVGYDLQGDPSETELAKAIDGALNAK